MALNQPFTALFVKLSAPEEISFMLYFILKSAGCKMNPRFVSPAAAESRIRQALFLQSVFTYFGDQFRHKLRRKGFFTKTP